MQNIASCFSSSFLSTEANVTANGNKIYKQLSPSWHYRHYSFVHRLGTFCWVINSPLIGDMRSNWKNKYHCFKTCAFECSENNTSLYMVGIFSYSISIRIFIRYICLILREKELLKIATLMRKILLVNMLRVWDRFFQRYSQ